MATAEKKTTKIVRIKVLLRCFIIMFSMFCVAKILLFLQSFLYLLMFLRIILDFPLVIRQNHIKANGQKDSQTKSKTLVTRQVWGLIQRVSTI
jgi:hypothetical protein